MTNFASSLKQEITRIARKELRNEVTALRNSNAAQKKQISELKKALAAVDPRLRALERAASRASTRGSEQSLVEQPPRNKPGRKVLFSAERLLSARKRFGFTQVQMAELLSVSSLTLWKWESGKSAPNPSRAPSVLETLSIGKREALRRIGQ